MASNVLLSLPLPEGCPVLAHFFTSWPAIWSTSSASDDPAVAIVFDDQNTMVVAADNALEVLTRATGYSFAQREIVRRSPADLR